MHVRLSWCTSSLLRTSSICHAARTFCSIFQIPLTDTSADWNIIGLSLRRQAVTRTNGDFLSIGPVCQMNSNRLQTFVSENDTWKCLQNVNHYVQTSSYNSLLCVFSPKISGFFQLMFLVAINQRHGRHRCLCINVLQINVILSILSYLHRARVLGWSWRLRLE